MAVVLQYNSSNSAPNVPGVVVTNVPPQQGVLSAAATNIVGVVGTASWGPVNVPLVCSGLSDYSTAFGSMQIRKYDAGTQVYVASLQGAGAFRVVRVTDGTDEAANVTLTSAELAKATSFYAALAAAINLGSGVLRGPSNLVIFNATTGMITAAYTGSLGSTVSFAITNGSKVGTFRAVVSMPGRPAELFDNIPATSGSPTLASHALIGGTDGASAITSAMLVGVDVQPRTGMYALRAQGIMHLAVADLDDTTQWTLAQAFGASECCYAHVPFPSGSTIAAAVAAKATAGIDNPYISTMHGDWLEISDPVNLVNRFVSPAAFKAGKLAALPLSTPNALNKPLVGIVASQTSAGGTATYSQAELQELLGAGIDVIATPSAGGSYWGVQGGINSSSNDAENGDDYTILANFFDVSLEGFGAVIGVPITTTAMQIAAAEANTFLSDCMTQGILSPAPGSTAAPYAVVCNASNNPGARTSQGYLRMDVTIQTPAICRQFNINCESGPTVVSGSSIP